MEYLLYCAFKEPTALYFDRVNIAQSQQLKSTELTIAIPESISKQSVINMIDSLVLSLHLDNASSCRFVRHMLPIAVEFRQSYLSDVPSSSTYVFVDLGSFFVTFCAVEYCQVGSWMSDHD